MQENMEAMRRPEMRQLEALLFSASVPLSVANLRPYFAPATDIVALLQDLAADYAGRGVMLVQRGEGWAFRTAPDLAETLAAQRQEMRRLSRAAEDCLAIIAYHQPITRAEIEALRGVSLSRGVLDHLLETGWVAPVGRRDGPGRPMQWGTTPAFLDHFSLVSLRDLPNLDELRQSGLIESGLHYATRGATDGQNDQDNRADDD